MTVIHHAISLAFKELRRDNYIAKQAYKCCGNCAGAAIANLVSEMPVAERKKLNGGVFYHKQDAEVLSRSTQSRYWGTRPYFSDETAYVSKDRYLAIRYGSIFVDDDEYGLPMDQIAIRVLDALRTHGIRATWSGDTGEVIRVVGLLPTLKADVRPGQLAEPLF